ncbi:MAG: class I tRNA ligase family protein, partial [Planctomycetaceae bacterium]
MFEKVGEASFIKGEHDVLRFWEQNGIFDKLRQQNAGKPKWNFLDGPITANNPMGVHHAWGRTYKDAYQRYYAMTGHELRYQNGFDCQGLWVEVEVEKQLNLGSKTAIEQYGIDKFVNECKRRVLNFAARQTEQSIRLGYWTDWDDPDTLRLLASKIGTDEVISIKTPRGQTVSGTASEIVAKLGNAEWGGSYFTFSTENNETIWTFLKKCFQRGKIYRGYDVMPWSGRGGSAYSQMEVADGRKLTVHKSIFVRFPLVAHAARVQATETDDNRTRAACATEYLLVWTTTPWTLTSNVAAAVNPDLDYVKLRSKRDGSVYYFAKDNLEYPRLAKEFKEGFGRPEWSWPSGVPKLKTIGQIFKEQGGYEIEATIKGAEMIGWEYTGPFDDLPAQSELGGVPFDPRVKDKCGKTCHRVVDGGRDFKGNPMVVAGEGTGIVHIAPGCGDVDHTLGQQLGIVGIAPLGEDGSFLDGFGPFTGRNSTDPATAEFVFEQLKAKHLLVNVEQYPHIYPHCWRTGDELVFRLVDEWFINMDWRDEIKEVTEAIRWLPDSINGKERELEWLTSMRDWMISKKRFWGLALPIWVEEYEVHGEKRLDFEVMGSLEELKSRAVEGWEVLEGHTPHRPWIDAVKIKNPKTGRLMSRIVDVGNPWLDAGIVPFSTTQFNTNREAWQSQYPLDFVTECFPGQFRNWFYSMLSLATMMMWEDRGQALRNSELAEL